MAIGSIYWSDHEERASATVSDEAMFHDVQTVKLGEHERAVSSEPFPIGRGTSESRTEGRIDFTEVKGVIDFESTQCL